MARLIRAEKLMYRGSVATRKVAEMLKFSQEVKRKNGKKETKGEGKEEKNR